MDTNRHFDLFHHLSLEREKMLTYQIWLKGSLVLASWGQGVILAQEIPFRGSKLLNFRFSPFSLYRPI